MKKFVRIIPIILIFGLSLFVLSLETAHAVELRLVTEQDVFGQGTREDMFNIIGMGRMMNKVNEFSGIKILSEAAKEAARETARQTGRSSSSGSMGARLRTVMGEVPFFEVGAEAGEAVDLSGFYDRPVVVGDLEDGNEAFQQGRMYPPRLVLSAIDFPTFSDTPTFQARAQTQMNRLYADQFNKENGTNIRVEVQGGVYHLTGTVSSAEDRKVAELMLAMEPGVETIVNELRVQAPSEDETLPQPYSNLNLDVVN